MGGYTYEKVETANGKHHVILPDNIVKNSNYSINYLPQGDPKIKILRLKNDDGHYMDVLVRRLERGASNENREENYKWKFAREFRILQTMFECESMGVPLSKEDIEIYIKYIEEKSKALKNVILSLISKKRGLICRTGEYYHLTESGRELLDTAKMDLFGRNFRFVDDDAYLPQNSDPTAIYLEILDHELEIPPPVSFKKKVEDCLSVIAERKYGVRTRGGCVGTVRCEDGRVEFLYGNARKVLAVNNRLTPIGTRVLEVLEEEEVEKYPELTNFLRVAGILNSKKEPTQLGEDLYSILRQTLKNDTNLPKYRHTTTNK